MVTINTVSTGAVAQFLQYTPQGTVDIKKTVKTFEDQLRLALKAHEDIKPTVIDILKMYSRLGEGALVQFATVKLALPRTGDSEGMIKAAIRDLEAEGKIAYQTNESGTKKGRNAGWKLVTA